ncbi:MAG: succinate dehydrogenase iron-sulfur subunit [Armatimonadetes bacterium]|nr:succinate dehydrogenase iron-sulfur subunit [Armatimonadota bacterium]
MSEDVILRIKRQENQGARARWEEFSVPRKPNMNVISALMEIQKNPVTRQGDRTTPVVWDCNCLEEVCGACSMLINDRARQACSALVDHLKQPILLEPMTKFPVVRDLLVDRSRMFESLKKVRAWIPIDGTYDLGPGPRLSSDDQQYLYEFSRCMTCGCCLEACPQVNSRSPFMGPAPLAQVALFNGHPTGARNRTERLRVLMGREGIASCGNAQNCVEVCPKEIPLTDAIADLNRQINVHGLLGMLRR